MPPLPAHPTLRPGLVVAARDQHHLQVGIDPPRRVLLPRLPDVVRLLDDLAQRRVPRATTPAAQQALHLLAERDLLVDAALLADDLARGPSRSAVAAAYAVNGDDAARRLRARRSLRVAVESGAAVRGELVRLLRESGCRPVGEQAAHDVRLAVLDGPPRISATDRWVRAGLPHLLVSGGDGRVTVGPLVVPGVTACLRCVEAHLAHDDPRRAVVASQAGRSGLVPVDPALQALACAWAVRALVGYAEGDRPPTWSASVLITPGELPHRRFFTPHPHCGCARGELRSARSRRLRSPVLAVELGLDRAQMAAGAHVAEGARSAVLDRDGPGEQRERVVVALPAAQIAHGAGAHRARIVGPGGPGHGQSRARPGGRTRLCDTGDQASGEADLPGLTAPGPGPGVPAGRQPRPCGSDGGRGPADGRGGGTAPLPGARTFVRGPGLR